MTHLATGYRFAGMHCGIRPDPARLDLAVVVSERPAAVGAAFTQNRVRAAPVRLCDERTPGDALRGVVVCSGNANACTGEQGLADARTMAARAAHAAGVSPESFLVASTGVIGRMLPMDRVGPGVERIVPLATADVAGLEAFARAILTTDTVIKIATRQVDGVTLTGVCKGAAMIGPNMATLLAFVFTDANVDPQALHALTKRAAAVSFNCVRVEGHTSTNDTLLVFANGTGPRTPLAPFAAAVEDVCIDLARQIAADAEGATHRVTIEVEGTRDDAEAYRIACAVADSPLCKTAIFGADPNWGRFVSAAGYAGVPFAEEQLSLWMGDVCLYERGRPLPFDAGAASGYMRNHRDLLLRLKLTLGSGRATVWTCDLTYDYVKLNADYTT